MKNKITKSDKDWIDGFFEGYKSGRKITILEVQKKLKRMEKKDEK